MQRFTSACAERTPPSSPLNRGISVHLRLRGADDDVPERPEREHGSPPPARSGRRDVPDHLALRRFTSACAERTGRGRSASPPAAVHLRLRGADRANRNGTSTLTGSPPPARSGPRARPTDVVIDRFTSACAERTLVHPAILGYQAVHLRLRGADSTRSGRPGGSSGSPPPARSGLRSRAGTALPQRFTSACAERTVSGNGTGPPSTVHLRLRGADAASWTAEPTLCGSPPPARSGPLVFLKDHVRAPVHLRLRGADHAASPCWSWMIGSPPPARSGRRRGPDRQRLRRFTSACAERTQRRS